MGGRFFKVDNVVSNREAKSLDRQAKAQTILQELRQGKVLEIDPMTSTVLVEEQTMSGPVTLSAKPLLRGLVDQPDVDSAVVLIDFESPSKKSKKQVMYLGPINTEDNATKNRMATFLDVYNTPAYQINNAAGERHGYKFQQKYNTSETPADEGSNWRKDFPKVIFSHLGKVADYVLDFPKEKYNKYKIPPEKHVTAPIGDMFMQGKFGNSIRLGQRFNKPNIIISNGRPPGTAIESFNDTSTIMLTQTGPLKNHLGHIVAEGAEPTEFISSVEGTDNTRRTNLVKEYEHGQIFIQSDRIVFNTKVDNIYMSSATTIDLNSMQNINLSTPKDTVIDSENIYLGRAAIENSNPAVLGNELNEILNEMLNILEGLSFIEYGNMPILYKGAPINAPGVFQNIRTKIDKMMSENVFIEPNIQEG